MTKPQGTRINARLPSDLARKISYLQQRTRKSATEVLHESIELLYASVREQESPASILDSTGFVGCAEGAPELSSTYKTALLASLPLKTSGGKKK
jgi:hypothetical protein